MCLPASFICISYGPKPLPGSRERDTDGTRYVVMMMMMIIVLLLSARVVVGINSLFIDVGVSGVGFDVLRLQIVIIIVSIVVLI